MQSVFVIVTKLIASKNYFCKEVSCNNFGRDGTIEVSYLQWNLEREYVSEHLNGV